MSKLIALIRWAWCPHCWVRTDQDKTDHGWRCQQCGEVCE